MLAYYSRNSTGPTILARMSATSRACRTRLASWNKLAFHDTDTDTDTVTDSDSTDASVYASLRPIRAISSRGSSVCVRVGAVECQLYSASCSAKCVRCSS